MSADAIAERATLEGLRVVAEHDPEPAIRDAAKAELERIEERKGTSGPTETGRVQV
jgi:hypothetical protein